MDQKLMDYLKINFPATPPPDAYAADTASDDMPGVRTRALADLVVFYNEAIKARLPQLDSLGYIELYNGGQPYSAWDAYHAELMQIYREKGWIVDQVGNKQIATNYESACYHMRLKPGPEAFMVTWTNSDQRGGMVVIERPELIMVWYWNAIREGATEVTIKRILGEHHYMVSGAPQ